MRKPCVHNKVPQKIARVSKYVSISEWTYLYELFRLKGYFMTLKNNQFYVQHEAYEFSHFYDGNWFW